MSESEIIGWLKSARSEFFHTDSGCPQLLRTDRWSSGPRVSVTAEEIGKFGLHECQACTRRRKLTKAETALADALQGMELPLTKASATEVLDRLWDSGFGVRVLTDQQKKRGR